MKHIWLGTTPENLIFQNQRRDPCGDISFMPLCILIIISCLNSCKSNLNLKYEKSWCKHSVQISTGISCKPKWLSHILLHHLVHVWSDTLSSINDLNVRPSTDLIPLQFCLVLITICHKTHEYIKHLLLGSGQEPMVLVTPSFSALCLPTQIYPLV